MAKSFLHGELTGKILGAACDIHTELGPGLLETAYRRCLVHELRKIGMGVREEVPIPIRFGGAIVECGFRADIVVEEKVLLELKAIDQLQPVHHAQILSYLRLSGLHVGLLINFHAASLRQGIKRFVQ